MIECLVLDELLIQDRKCLNYLHDLGLSEICITDNSLAKDEDSIRTIMARASHEKLNAVITDVDSLINKDIRNYDALIIRKTDVIKILRENNIKFKKLIIDNYQNTELEYKDELLKEMIVEEIEYLDNGENLTYEKQFVK